MTRRRTAGAAVLAFACALVLAAGARADVAAPSAIDGIAIVEHPGAALPLEARFRDERGRDVRLGHYFDGHRPVLLTLAYTRCPMLCGLVLEGAADAVAASRRQGGVSARLLTVSIDARDSPEDLAPRARILRARAGLVDADDWAIVAGAPGEVARLAAAVGFAYRRDPETGEYAHPSVLVAVAPDGRIARYVYGVQFEPAEVEAALGAAARGDVGRSLTQALIHCFRYVPVLRRHASAVALFLRGAAVLILFGLAGVFALARRRGRRSP